MVIEREPPAVSPDPHPTLPGRRRGWRFPAGAAVIAVLALVGVLVLSYPGAAAWLSQYNQSKLIDDVEQVVAVGPASKLQNELARAHEYNDALTGGALVAAGANVPRGEGSVSAEFEYSSLLRATDSGAMGRIKIPSIAADLPIYHGTSDDTLAKGVGHLEGTALPVGGESMHAVLTAHRGLPSAELFTNLDQVERGDSFTIEVFGEVLTYTVFDIRVVAPDETEELRPEYGRDLVTLVTCTPLGINTQRILVTGERVTPTPQADLDKAGRSPDIPGFPWWAVGLGGAIIVLTGYVVWAGRGRGPESKDQAGQSRSAEPPPTFAQHPPEFYKA